MTQNALQSAPLRGLSSGYYAAMSVVQASPARGGAG